MRNPSTLLVQVVLVLVIMVPTASGNLTTVANPWPGQPGGGDREWNLFDTGGGAGIMEYLYGSFTRLDDSADQVWADGTGSVTVEAKYAGYTQDFGWYDKTNGISHYLLTQEANLSPMTGGGTSLTFDVGPGIDFAWWDDTTASGGGLYYSDELLNPMGNDHMVTFEVLGAYTDFSDLMAPTGWSFFDDGPHYVLGFEDLNLGDKDYNDLVIEVTTVHPVPIPGALALGAIGMGLVGVARRRRAS